MGPFFLVMTLLTALFSYKGTPSTATYITKILFFLFLLIFLVLIVMSAFDSAPPLSLDPNGKMIP